MAEAAVETIETPVEDTADLSTMSAEKLQGLIDGTGAERKEEAAPEVPETPVAEAEPTETPVEEPKEDPAIVELRAELEKVKKQVNDKETFIQRQAQELGQLRKSVRPPAPPEVNILDNPVEAINQVVNYRDALLNQQRLENQQAVLSAVPDVTQHMDTIVHLALADGYTEQQVAQFRQDPYLYSTPNVLISYARRAAQIKETAELKAKLTEQETTIAQLKTKPEELLKKVEQAAKQTPGLTGKTGEPSVAKHDISDKTFSQMTDAELAAWLKENNQ